MLALEPSAGSRPLACTRIGKSQQVNALLQKAKATPDHSRRQQLYGQVTQMMDDEVPGVFLFLFEQDVIYAVGKRLANWKPRPDDIICYADLGGS